MKTSYDVVIVGAGPAGIFTAIEMIKLGTKQSILIIEMITRAHKRVSHSRKRATR